jgi:hypothetical protein
MADNQNKTITITKNVEHKKKCKYCGSCDGVDTTIGIACSKCFTKECAALNIFSAYQKKEENSPSTEIDTEEYVQRDCEYEEFYGPCRACGYEINGSDWAQYGFCERSCAIIGSDRRKSRLYK